MPQYSLAATGSATEKLLSVLGAQWNIPEISVKKDFFNKHHFIAAYPSLITEHIKMYVALYIQALYMIKMSLSFPRMRESISSSGVFPLQAWIPAFARMTKLEHFIFCHGQKESPSVHDKNVIVFPANAGIHFF